MLFKNKLSNNILFIFFNVFLEYSITTIDFIFLEKISYLAAIGVGSIISLIFMFQRIIVLFVQSIIDSCIYYYSSDLPSYRESLLIGFLVNVILAIIMSILFFYYKDIILSFFHIKNEAKIYAISYMNYMMFFLLSFSLQCYFHYVLYSLNMVKINLFIMLYITILNIIFNSIAVYELNYGAKGIAISSNLAIICSLPLYLFFMFNKGIFFIKWRYIKYKYIAFIYKSLKNIGFASILEPILVQGVDVIIKIIIVTFVATEALSARVHISNYFTIVISLSIAMGISLQMIFSKFLGANHWQIVNKIYSKYFKWGLCFVILLSIVVAILIYFNVHLITANSIVREYVLVLSLCGLFVEPSRFLSIFSKSYLKGLQRGNIILVATICIKLCIVYPFIYFGLSIWDMGLYAIILGEMINYLTNYIVFTILINYHNGKKIPLS